MFCVLWFLGWEAYAVWDARQNTSEIFSEFGDKTALSIQWSDLTARKQEILLKIEDPKFFTHKGLDFETHGVGTSTITQVLARALYFEKFTPGFTEIEQSLIAFFVIDPLISKEMQLTAYLNIADFGEHGGQKLQGFDPAARVFMGKPVDELTNLQFIQLMAVLLEPSTMAPGAPESLKRAAKIEAYVTGKCSPRSRRDVTYDHC